MRPQLQRLLLAGGVPADALERWQRVAFMANWGSLAPSSADPHQNASNRGLHVVVLGNDGVPTHYCKLRRIDPNGVPLRESVLLESFSTHPLSAAVVPRTTVARDGRLEGQVADYLSGERFDRVVPQLSLVERSQATSRVLDAAAAIASAARDLPEVFPDLTSHVTVDDAARDALALLPDLGLSSSDTALYQGLLKDIEPVPAVTQHRDLWPKNVITQSTGYKIVDFDDYGIVTVPMYDAFHLVLCVDDLARPRDGRRWLDRLSARDDDGTQMRRVLRKAGDDLNLTLRQRMGCLVYYLIDVPVFIYQRGAPEIYWGRYRDELPHLARLIRAAASLDDLCHRLFSEA